MEPTSVNRAAHWQSIYQTKRDADISWFQEEPQTSLELIRACVPPRSRIVDIGGGASVLAGRLAGDGHAVTVVDISSAALDRAKQRIGAVADQIRWIVGDVTTISDLGLFDLWHDRAVFHFLTDPADRRRYVSLSECSVVQGGHAVIGTFALDGPEKCSGLPVQRYDASTLANAFGSAFMLVRSVPHTHITPWGKPQAFTFTVLKRV